MLVNGNRDADADADATTSKWLLKNSRRTSWDAISSLFWVRRCVAHSRVSRFLSFDIMSVQNAHFWEGPFSEERKERMGIM